MSDQARCRFLLSVNALLPCCCSCAVEAAAAAMRSHPYPEIASGCHCGGEGAVI